MELFTRSIIEQKVIECIKLRTHLTNHLSLEDSLESLQLNSIIFVKIVITLEEEFNIEFDDDKLIVTAFTSVGDISNYICDRLLD